MMLSNLFFFTGSPWQGPNPSADQQAKLEAESTGSCGFAGWNVFPACTAQRPQDSDTRAPKEMVALQTRADGQPPLLWSCGQRHGGRAKFILRSPKGKRMLFSVGEVKRG